VIVTRVAVRHPKEFCTLVVNEWFASIRYVLVVLFRVRRIARPFEPRSLTEWTKPCDGVQDDQALALATGSVDIAILFDPGRVWSMSLMDIALNDGATINSSTQQMIRIDEQTEAKSIDGTRCTPRQNTR
jgi:hypothetical protein